MTDGHPQMYAEAVVHPPDSLLCFTIFTIFAGLNTQHFKVSLVCYFPVTPFTSPVIATHKYTHTHTPTAKLNQADFGLKHV